MKNKDADKNGRHIREGYKGGNNKSSFTKYERQLLSKGYQLGQSENGGLFVVINLNPITRSFLTPVIPIIQLKENKYSQGGFEVSRFMELGKLLRRFNLPEKLDMAFAILVNEVSLAIRQNKFARTKEPEKLLELKRRFSELDFPKSITVKYSKTDSYTLPPELIATFWKSFVYDSESVPIREPIPVDTMILKVLESSPLQKKERFMLVEELQKITGLYSPTTYPHGIVDKIEKRVSRQNQKK